MHEDHHAQLLGAGEETVELQVGVGQVLAVDVGADLDAPKTEVLDAMIELLDCQLGVLQRHRSHADKAVRGVGHHLGDALVDFAREFRAIGRFGPVKEVIRRRAYRLDVHAHAVHVLQALRHAGQFWSAGRHLLDVGLTRDRVGEHRGGVVLGGIQVRGFLVDRRVQVVTMQVNHFGSASLATRKRAGQARGGALGCRGAGRAVVMRGVGATRGAGVKHEYSSKENC